jgi:hypothetical protein
MKPKPSQRQERQAMRVKMQGRINKEEVLKLLQEAMNALDQFDVQEYSGINVYFKLHDSSGQEVIPEVDGKEVDSVTVGRTPVKVKKSKPQTIEISDNVIQFPAVKIG